MSSINPVDSGTVIHHRPIGFDQGIQKYGTVGNGRIDDTDPTESLGVGMSGDGVSSFAHFEIEGDDLGIGAAPVTKGSGFDPGGGGVEFVGVGAVFGKVVVGGVGGVGAGGEAGDLPAEALGCRFGEG